MEALAVSVPKILNSHCPEACSPIRINSGSAKSVNVCEMFIAFSPKPFNIKRKILCLRINTALQALVK